jgi:hypothetical protein
MNCKINFLKFKNKSYFKIEKKKIRKIIIFIFYILKKKDRTIKLKIIFIL